MASFTCKKNILNVMSWMISSLASSGKYLARNLKMSGLSLAMSWLSTFLFSLSQVSRPLVSLYCKPKYQISRRPIVLTTWSNNCLPVVVFCMENSNSASIVITRTFTGLAGILERKKEATKTKTIITITASKCYKLEERE